MYGSIRWYNLSGGQVCWHVSKILKGILFDSAIHLLENMLYSNTPKSTQGFCTKMFTAALMVKVKNRNQPIIQQQGVVSCLLVQPMEFHEDSKENGEP